MEQKNNNKKGNTFFKKVKSYVQGSAWIQPLLIVVVIFVILFSLNPITTGISKLWNKVTVVNHMEKISYSEYVNKVETQQEGDKFVIVFTQGNCDVCPKFYKGMNNYLKSTDYKNGDFKIYNVDLSVKSGKKEIGGTKYKQYKDSSCGIVSNFANSDDVRDLDYISQLDERIDEFAKIFEDDENSYTYLTKVTETLDKTNPYTYVSTPLIIWYDAGIETRMCNTFESQVEFANNNDSVPTEKSFRKFISDFEGADYEGGATFYGWDDNFDLGYNGK